jgi:hypothetical protein
MTGQAKTSDTLVGPGEPDTPAAWPRRQTS